MSKQKSTKTETQRFSGPELSELLDQVAREHGADAAISAVNRIRSGGIAGFFCREEFEVVVKSPGVTPVSGRQPETTPKPQPQAKDHDDAQPGLTVAAAAAASPVVQADHAPAKPTQPAPVPIQPAPVPIQAPVHVPGPEQINDDAQPASAPDPLSVLLNQSNSRLSSAMADHGRGVVEDDGANSARVHDLRSNGDGEQIFGGPIPPENSWTDTRFRALLDHRTEEVSAGVQQHVERQSRRAATAEVRSQPVGQPNLQATVPAPGLGVPLGQSTGIGVMTPTAGELPDFWLRLQRAQHELASFMPLSSSSVATIGPLSLITPIAGRLRSQPGLESATVIVLTDRAEIVSEPSWRLVRSGNQLLDAVNEQPNCPMLLLIDVPVELPNWVAPLENRLRMAGIGLFRYAVPGSPTPSKLDNYRVGSDVPYVIDLVSRVEPDRLVEFIALRHPIASVAGADLNAELLVAMREQVGVGP